MDRKNEILAVKKLGEQIGYGNMMDIASALWSMRLSEDGLFRTGHVPTVEPFMKRKEAKKVQKHIKVRISEIEKELNE